MRTGRSQATRGLLVAGAAAGLMAALGGGSPAAADQSAQAAASTSTISMRFDKKRGPRFTGSTQVRAGQPLRMRNLSDPRTIGPHTFSLVASRVLPRSRKAGQRCFTPGNICFTIATAHEFNPKTEKIGKQLSEAGQPGWDARFSRTSRTGDSWYTEKKGETFEQIVSARPGTVLSYFCAIHPEMQGKIKVVG